MKTRACWHCNRIFTHPSQYRIEIDAGRYVGQLYHYLCRWGCRIVRQEAEHD